jgi:hypothetical protein
VKPDPHHPITDLDATFSPIPVQHTQHVMDALRKAGVYFDVTVNGPKEDPQSPSHDIFWFQKEDDQQKIGDIIRSELPKK